jgi:hypothetical protein
MSERSSSDAQQIVHAVFKKLYLKLPYFSEYPKGNAEGGN